MKDNVKAVEGIYAAFGRAEVKTILAALSEDVVWDQWSSNFAQAEGVPWLARRHGKAQVAEFFAYISTWKIIAFRVLSLMAGGNQVVAEVVIDVEMPGGARLQDEELHLWTFDDNGRVARLRHYNDTAKHIAVARGSK